MDFTKKDNFKPITIKIYFNGSIQKMYICKSAILEYPEILSNIKDDIWEILNYPFNIIRSLLSDLYELHIHTISSKLEVNEDILDLYRISTKYNVKPLIVRYGTLIQELKLTPNVFNFLVEYDFIKQIPTLYLRTNHNEITFELTELFSIGIWDMIIKTDSLNSLELLYNYVIKFRPTEWLISDILDAYYKIKKVYAEDLTWIVNCDEISSCLEKNIIMKCLLEKISKIDFLPKNAENNSSNQNDKQLLTNFFNSLMYSSCKRKLK